MTWHIPVASKRIKLRIRRNKLPCHTLVHISIVNCRVLCARLFVPGNPVMHVCKHLFVHKPVPAIQEKDKMSLCLFYCLVHGIIDSPVRLRYNM